MASHLQQQGHQCCHREAGGFDAQQLRGRAHTSGPSKAPTGAPICGNNRALVLRQFQASLTRRDTPVRSVLKSDSFPLGCLQRLHRQTQQFKGRQNAPETCWPSRGDSTRSRDYKGGGGPPDLRRHGPVLTGVQQRLQVGSECARPTRANSPPHEDNARERPAVLVCRPEEPGLLPPAFPHSETGPNPAWTPRSPEARVSAPTCGHAYLCVSSVGRGQR